MGGIKVSRTRLLLVGEGRKRERERERERETKHMCTRVRPDLLTRPGNMQYRRRQHRPRRIYR